MREMTGNIWGQKCNWLCVTTNGITKASGRVVMGKGVALQAKQRYPEIDLVLAQKIKERGNVVSPLIKKDGRWIISFPTKHDWKQPSDLKLIEKSARELKQHFDEQAKKPIVLLPRPGCGNGELKWEDVKKVLEPILTDPEFIIITINKLVPRILICGDRNWSNRNLIQAFLASVPKNSVIIEGECRGADKMAGEVAGALGMEVLKFPCDWSLGKKSGPLRNKKMLVDGKPTHVIAFHDNIETSKGTKNMLSQAQKAGIPVYLNAQSWKEIHR